MATPPSKELRIREADLRLRPVVLRRRDGLETATEGHICVIEAALGGADRGQMVAGLDGCRHVPRPQELEAALDELVCERQVTRHEGSPRPQSQQFAAVPAVSFGFAERDGAVEDSSHPCGVVPLLGDVGEEAQRPQDIVARVELLALGQNPAVVRLSSVQLGP